MKELPTEARRGHGQRPIRADRGSRISGGSAEKLDAAAMEVDDFRQVEKDGVAHSASRLSMFGYRRSVSSAAALKLSAAAPRPARATNDRLAVRLIWSGVSASNPSISRIGLSRTRARLLP